MRGSPASFAAALVLAASLAAPVYAQKASAGAPGTGPASVAPALAGSMRAFASDPSTLPAEWRAAYIPIAFQYPADWRIDPTAGASGFLVNASRPVPGYGEGEVSEIFAAFPFAANEASLDSDVAAALVSYGDWMRQAWGFPGSTRRDVTIGGRSFPALAFQGATDPDETVWGRLVIMPLVREAGQVKGVGLVMVGSSLAPEIHSADDVGARGGMPTILATFRAGGWSAAAAAPAPVVPAAAPVSSPAPGSGLGGLSGLLSLLGAGNANGGLEETITRLLGGTSDPQLQASLSTLLTRLQGGAPASDVLAALQPILARLSGGSAGSAPAMSAPAASAASAQPAPTGGEKPRAGP